MDKVLRAKNDILFFAEEPYFFPNQKLYPKQADILHKFYNPPHKELVLLKGMRGGGSFVASIIGLHDTFDLLVRDDPAADYGIASHSTIYILCVAKSDDQAADTIFRQMTDKIRFSPFFQSFHPRIRQYDVHFRKKPDVVILAGGAPSASSLAGRNDKCVIFDEIAKYDETKSQRGAWNVYSVLSKGTMSFKFQGHIVALSSCLHSKDIIVTLLERARHNPSMLGFNVPTWEMNPNLPFDGLEMRAELKKDPLLFWRDFGNKPWAQYDAYYHELDVVKLDETMPNILEVAQTAWQAGAELPNVPIRENYVLSGDPALKQDAFGLALEHREKDQFIADGLFRWEPTKKLEIDPIAVRDFLVWLVKQLHIRTFVTDTWNFPEAFQLIRAAGAKVYQQHVKKEDHDLVKQDFYLNRLRLCNYPFILKEFEDLRVINAVKVDHIRGGSMDVVSALTNAHKWLNENRVSTRIPSVMVPMNWR